VTLRATYPRLFRTIDRPVTVLGRVGDHTLFYGKA
jgi:phospholipid/cholesterol/gamma-HCH transport system permease protein